MKNRITVIPLGPGRPELMTVQSVNALQSAKRIILRTSRHPVSSWLTEQGLSWQSMDSFYDEYDEFEEMHLAMAEWLWQESAKSPLCFGVMTPQTDGAVLALKKTCPSDGSLQILPGLSPLDSCFSAIPTEKELGNSFCLFSATDFLSSYPDPGISIFVTEIDSQLLAGRVKLQMEEYYDDEQEIWFFPSSVKKQVQPIKIPLYLLDGQKKYDHTVSVLIPGKCFLHRVRYSWQDLIQIVEKLRAPDGCPWDRIQTHETLRPYLVEEAWEAVNAIEEQNPDHLADELGDVLFQVFIHASIAQTIGEFSLNDVITKIGHKMIHRHPHVFGTAMNGSAKDIVEGWEQLKREESGSQTVGESLNEISRSLPALKYSSKVFKKLNQIPAFLRDPQTIVSEIRCLSAQLMHHEELSAENMSRLLMACAELCFRQHQDAELLLHQRAEQFKEQYQSAEKNILKDHHKPENLTSQQLYVYLNSVEGN